MRNIAQFVSLLALAATLLAATLFFADRITLSAMRSWLLGATVIWFISTPLWMGRKAR